MAIDQRELDMSGLNLDQNTVGLQEADVPVPRVLAREKLLEEVRKSSQIHGENNKIGVNLVVIGEVAHAVISFAGNFNIILANRSRRRWQVDLNGEAAL
jgi:hypothetical protein